MLPVGLGQGRGEHGARPQLQLRPQLFVGKLVVSLIRNPVDDRVLDDPHHQVVADTAEPHVLEQAGGVERLQAAVDAVGVELVARLNQQIGSDGAVLDTLVPLDLDRLDDAAVSDAGAGRRAGVARWCGRSDCAKRFR